MGQEAKDGTGKNGREHCNTILLQDEADQCDEECGNTYHTCS